MDAHFHWSHWLQSLSPCLFIHLLLSWFKGCCSTNQYWIVSSFPHRTNNRTNSTICQLQINIEKFNPLNSLKQRYLNKFTYEIHPLSSREDFLSPNIFLGCSMIIMTMDVRPSNRTVKKKPSFMVQFHDPWCKPTLSWKAHPSTAKIGLLFPTIRSFRWFSRALRFSSSRMLVHV